ncbi:MAG: hypothetical protein JF887_00220 [Candidatus Dormibacteraeota bacterium]|uniref:Carbon monoxide dehydrogenase n=1 Tax=Candidatus Amunia macphersoniae TaxID=3127014 RepID=A0A934KCL2_9BACT|nr:hypothetical protein [Candidatus Dormibacteraeota bacterium]
MQLDNTFAVTAPRDQVWHTLMDFEHVAGCVPGASVVALSEDAFEVTMRVRLGPITMQYKGTLDVVERDAAAHRAVVRGRAQEVKGQGTAEGTIELRLAEDGEVTRGSCRADVKLSGRAAAMGKGVITKVGEQLMGQFANNLQALLVNQPTADSGAPGGDPAVPERSGDTVVEGVETLAAGSRSEGVQRDPQDATPHTAPVEQVEGDRAMTEGRKGTGSRGGKPADVPETRMREAPVSGGAQSSPAARVSDRVSAEAQGGGSQSSPAANGSDRVSDQSHEGDHPAVPERSGETVVEGVETLAAGTRWEGVQRDPEEATPGTAPVEQVKGDQAMTEGRAASTSGAGARPDVPETRMPEAPVSGGAQSSPAARVSDRVSASGRPLPVPSRQGTTPKEPESLDALALVGSVVKAQLGQTRTLLGLLPAGVLVGFWLGRRSARR